MMARIFGAAAAAVLLWTVASAEPNPRNDYVTCRKASGEEAIAACIARSSRGHSTTVISHGLTTIAAGPITNEQARGPVRGHARDRLSAPDGFSRRLRRASQVSPRASSLLICARSPRQRSPICASAVAPRSASIPAQRNFSSDVVACAYIWAASAANENGVVFAAPSMVRQPFVICVRHDCDASNGLLRYRQEEADALLRYLQRLDRNNDAALAGSKESP
jgi:hypothetical protein